MYRNSIVKLKLLNPSLVSDHNHDSVHYEADKSLSQFITIMHKPFSERSFIDDNILTSFLNNYTSLHQLLKGSENPQEKLLKISQHAQYEHYWAGSEMFDKGDFSDKVYLILKGSAIVYTEVNNDSVGASEEIVTDSILGTHTLEQEEENSIEETSKRDVKVNRKRLSQLFKPKQEKHVLKRQTTLGDFKDAGQTKFLDQEMPSKEQIEEALDPGETGHKRDLNSLTAEYKLLVKANTKKVGKYIKRSQFMYKPKLKLPEGSYFGEVGLLTNNLRVWTVIAAEEMHIITIEREDYFSLFQERLEYLDKNIQFLKPFFPHAASSKLSKLVYFFEECQLPSNAVIFEDGQDIDCFYLIKEGQVQLEKNLQIMSPSSKSINSTHSPKAKHRQRCIISKIKQGEALGEEDFFFQQKREYTAIVTSASATLLKFRLEIFEELHQSYQILFDSLRRASIIKIQVRQDKIRQHLYNEEILEITRAPSLDRECGNNLKLPIITNPYTQKDLESPSKANYTPASASLYQKVQARKVNRVPVQRDASYETINPREAHNHLRQFLLDLLPPKEAKNLVKRERFRQRAIMHHKKQTMSKEERHNNILEVDEEKQPSHRMYLNKIHSTKNLYDQRSMFYRPNFSDNSESSIVANAPVKFPMLKMKQESIVQVKSISPSPKSKKILTQKVKCLVEKQQKSNDKEPNDDGSFVQNHTLELKLNSPPIKDIYAFHGNFRIGAEKKKIALLNPIAVNMPYDHSNFMLSDDRKSGDLLSVMAVSEVEPKSGGRTQKEVKERASVLTQDRYSGTSWEWPKNEEYDYDMNGSIHTLIKEKGLT